MSPFKERYKGKLTVWFAILLLQGFGKLCLARNEKDTAQGGVGDDTTYLNYPHFHFAGRFRADTATTNNFPTNYDNNNFIPIDAQPSEENWNPMGSGEWTMEVHVTRVCYSDAECVEDEKEEPMCGANITDGGTRVPAKLVDLDCQAHKFAEVWGWRIVANGYFSADFLPASFQYRWVKTANASDSDATQGAAGQSKLTNVIWNERNLKAKSRIWDELRNATSPEGVDLSIRFNMDAFNESPQDQYFGWGRITGTVGVAGLNSFAFVSGERMLKALREGLQNAPFVLDSNIKKLTVDFGNSLPIMKDGNHSVPFLGKLIVAMPTQITEKRVACSDNLTKFGEVLYQTANWYETTAGVQSFNLTNDEIERLQRTPLVVAEMFKNGTCKRILLSEALDGVQVHPISEWAVKAEPGEDVELKFLATKFGTPEPGVRIHFKSFVCHKIFYEYGGPYIGTDPLPFPRNYSILTDPSGIAKLNFTANDPKKIRKYIDGQLYPYVYWAANDTIHEKEVCDGPNYLSLLNSYVVIKVYDNFTYKEPATWIEDVFPILKTYANLYPVMTKNYIDLGSYHDVLKNTKAIERTMGFPMEHPNYMPVTRDLSRRKREMILKWLKTPCPGQKKEVYSVEYLRKLLQTAMQVEHATIPTYLTALATIKSSYNEEVQAIFKQILIQEMLHLALAANLLNAVDGRPVIFSANFIPFYPSRLPGGLMPDLEVPIDKCSIALINNIFMKIEQPSVTVLFSEDDSYDDPEEVSCQSDGQESLRAYDSGTNEKKAGNKNSNLPTGTSTSTTASVTNDKATIIGSREKECGDIPDLCPQPHSYPFERDAEFERHFNTIGEFYNHTWHVMEYLENRAPNKTIFTGAPSKQLFFHFHFGSHGKLINVTNLSTAREAIQEIIREGEGSSPCNPFDWFNDTGDLSHYFLFKSIVEKHGITVHPPNDTEKRCGGEFFFNGTKIFFDSDGVWPMMSNPTEARYNSSTRAYVVNREFNRQYTNLLRSLDHTFNGYPETFHNALGLMYTIDRYLKELVRTPLEPNGDPNIGPNAGPTFEFTPY